MLEKEQIYVRVVIETTLNIDEKDFWSFFSIPVNSFYNWLLLRSAFAGVAAYLKNKNKIKLFSGEARDILLR